ncbi:hypothetical protein Trydic_g16214 [Trypoxylus dichotomus]
MTKRSEISTMAKVNDDALEWQVLMIGSTASDAEEFTTRGRANIVGQCIDAKDARPIRQAPRSIDGRFILDIDVSNTSIGGVLFRLLDWQERVTGYFSKILSKQEYNYCNYETRRELLEVV